MTIVSESNSYDEFLAILPDKDDKDGWKKLIKKLGSLIHDDTSLRGDLCHIFCFFHSTQLSEDHRKSLDAVCKDIIVFSSYISNIAPNLPKLQEKEKQSLRKFFERQNNTFNNTNYYSILILYVIKTSLDHGKFFSEHHIIEEIGQFGELVSELRLRLTSEPSSISKLLEYVDEFSELRSGHRTVKRDLGGMLELGNLTPFALWQIFGDKGANIQTSYKLHESIERKFICYRYSSVAGRPELVKSYLVLQSPGAKRDHFAFKIFFKSSSNRKRRGAGAIVNLGSIIAMFGSARSAPNNPDEMDQLAESFAHSGAKAFLFETTALTRASPIVGGVLSTINDNDRPIATRVLCVETNIEHSDDADIGRLPPGSLKEELEKYSLLGEEGDYRFEEPETREAIAEWMQMSLAHIDREGVVQGYTSEDLDIRRFR